MIFYLYKENNICKIYKYLSIKYFYIFLLASLTFLSKSSLLIFKLV